jgi:arsenate reductase
MLKFYGYRRCGTCRKALAWLDDHGVDYRFVDITETPPPKTLLRALLQEHEPRALFNTSGQQYRELGMKDRLPTLSRSEAVDLLAANGKLCKRPLVTDGTRHTVGFQPDRFAAVWG